jgi:hypothetical protein
MPELTKRELIAAIAIHGYLANDGEFCQISDLIPKAFKVADAFLEYLETGTITAEDENDAD